MNALIPFIGVKVRVDGKGKQRRTTRSVLTAAYKVDDLDAIALRQDV